jgi:protein-tyrosine phosphatase
VNRDIPLAGADNFRDVGGVRTTDGRRVRWRRLFRSASLQQLTDDDLAVLHDLGITTVVDLRAASEAAREGLGRVEELGVRHCSVPLIREDEDHTYEVPTRTDLDSQYFEILQDAGAEVAGIIRLLAQPGALPAVVHCAAGKDRTGIVTGVVLSVLGVPAPAVVADYARSGAHMVAVVDRLRRLPSYGPRVDLVPAGVWSAKAANMDGLLARVDARWGSACGWARAQGLDDDVLKALAEALLEDG